MNIIPAKVAGVERIVMTTPPGADGKVTPVTLVAAHLAGATEVYKVGGAQAVAHGNIAVAKIGAALAVADNHVRHLHGREHLRRNLAGKSALLRPLAVLRANVNVGAFRRLESGA